MYNENGDVMLVNMKDILKSKTVFQFNINNLEWTKAILEEVNELKEPVILGASENAIKYMGGYKVVSQIVKSLIEELEIKVPVVIHLDHGKNIESCKKALEAGFTSVMIDASNYSLEENIKITKQVVELAQKCNASVEAGINKININTDLQIAWARGIKKYLKSNKKEYDPRKILEPGSEEIKKIVKNKIAILPK